MQNTFFIHAKTRDAFDEALKYKQIDNQQVVFIEDTEEIYTQGQFYCKPAVLIGKLEYDLSKGYKVEEFLKPDNYSLVIDSKVSDKMETYLASKLIMIEFAIGGSIDTPVCIQNGKTVSGGVMTQYNLGFFTAIDTLRYSVIYVDLQNETFSFKVQNLQTGEAVTSTAKAFTYK